MKPLETTFSEREAERERVHQLREAAPDLLKACEQALLWLGSKEERMTSTCDTLTQLQDLLTAAIKKARP